MHSPIPLVSLIAIVTLSACSGISVNDSGTLTIGGGTDTLGVTSEFCDGDQDTSAAPIADCQVGALVCGDVVSGTTVGGTTLWDLDMHQSNFCFVDGNNYDGKERLWTFEQAAYSEVNIRLDACNQAALSVMSWSDPDSCPEPGGLINRCEGTADVGGDVTFFSDTDLNWVVGVDSPEGQEGNFTLTVTCG